MSWTLTRSAEPGPHGAIPYRHRDDGSPADAPATLEELAARLVALEVRVTALEGLGGNLVVSLTPDAPGGEPAPQGPPLPGP
jgi:hypothetical protein